MLHLIIKNNDLTNPAEDISIRRTRPQLCRWIHYRVNSAKPGAKSYHTESIENQLMEHSKTTRLSSQSLGMESSAAQVGTKFAVKCRPAQKSRRTGVPVQAIAIGGSTGAPRALHSILAEMKDIRDLPIFVTQHMPASFTTILADQLSKSSGRNCTEGKDGEVVISDHIYIAPGDFHMTVNAVGHERRIAINQGPLENFCRPAVDPMLRSLSEVYGAGLIAVILTGMGQDGLAGCRNVAALGGGIVVQDEESSVVWGMPGAVAKAGLAQHIVSLQQIASTIRSIVGVQIR